MVRRSLRRALRGLWLRGVWPLGGAVLAANHHSWWDGYLAGELAWAHCRPPAVLMDDAQLTRFAFFRHLGALGTRELRPALRRLRAGQALVIYPEGRLRPPAPVSDLRPGAAWLAERADVPLLPLAVRVVMRGHEAPEAYAWIGPPSSGPQLEADLNRLLGELDHALGVHDPERPLPGFDRVMRGRASTSERLGGPSRLLLRLTGEEGR
nr:lysophospholipid acyltransferase family protein [Deinobacterium chartae]